MNKIQGGSILVEGRNYTLTLIEYDTWAEGQTITVYSSPDFAGKAEAEARITRADTRERADLTLETVVGPTKYKYTIKRIIGDLG